MFRSTTSDLHAAFVGGDVGVFFVSAACDDEGVGALAGKSDILVNNVNQFKARLDKFWMHQDVKFDFTADLTGIGDRSVRVICDV